MTTSPAPSATTAVPATPAQAWLAVQAHIDAGNGPAAGPMLHAFAAIAPTDAATCNDLVAAFSSCGLSAQSLPYAQRAVDLHPQDDIARSNLCELLRRAGRMDDAVHQGRHAVALNAARAGNHYHLGMAYAETLRMDEAIAHLRQALALEPRFAQAHFELAEALLLTTQFQEGWQEYEWRYAMPHVKPLLPPGHTLPVWDGQALPDRSLLVVCDQGYGDVMQFCRYLEHLQEHCPNLVVAASPPVLPLVRQQSPQARYFSQWQDMGHVDCHIPLTSLPRIFGAGAGPIPLRIPYIKADATRATYWRDRLDQAAPAAPRRRVGVVWAGRPEHDNDARRSLTLAQLAPLAAMPNTTLVSLQVGAARDQVQQYRARAPLLDVGGLLTDYAETAAVIAGLDHVVCVDTSVAHLAGAMGVPTSVLLPHAPDWRWMLGRNDSPWYPSLRLYRQVRPCDWSGVVEAVARDLAGKA
ncbi:tetratricopeptide repeat-containing glycosyltransferase family protein [Bordetella sp. LUAb4]|uniref:tetratricopeptide repeat-containing glycosyltransferase family protein n=1 Tax=Bordetella sp. LUAb4 TaxID=2843195 RepID=UPI001E3C8D15|nr:tetratricopeptide repeat-containing glycosyltransferase family protein [Bordetella sp. LUAb4]